MTLFANTGRRTVAFGDTRRSRLLGRRGREPLAADRGCGYAFTEPGRRLPIIADACQRYLDTFTVAPGRTASREVSLTWELPGRSRLTAGRYVFRRVVRFAPGTTAPDAGEAPDRVARIIYTIRPGRTRRDDRGAGWSEYPPQ